MNKAEALAQKCYCGRFLIGAWQGRNDTEGIADTSVYMGGGVPYMQERHAKDICLAPRRLPKEKP